MNDPAAELLAICRRVLDPDAQPIALRPGHNGTAVLHAATAVGEVIVKRHRGRERHDQEVHAYRQWTPVLLCRAPQLLAVSDDPPAIVLTALPGRPLADSRPDPGGEAEAHKQAGELLRLLHHAAPSRSEPDMTVWLAERGEQWLTLAAMVLPARRRAEIREHLRALAEVEPVSAVPCHLDFTPRNLLYSEVPDPRIAVIDFEHARYDLAARDLVRLATRIWRTRPDLEAAFLGGYGRLSDLDRQIMEHCTHLDALTAAVRAVGVGPSAPARERLR
jgi:hypothetical protein